MGKPVTEYGARIAVHHAHLRNWRNWPSDELAAYIKKTGGHPKYLDQLRPIEWLGLALMVVVIIVCWFAALFRGKELRRSAIEMASEDFRKLYRRMRK